MVDSTITNYVFDGIKTGDFGPGEESYVKNSTMIDLFEYYFDKPVPPTMKDLIPRHLLRNSSFEDAMHAHICVEYLEYIVANYKIRTISMMQEICAQLFYIRFGNYFAVADKMLYAFVGHGWIAEAEHYLIGAIRNGFKIFLDTRIAPLLGNVTIVTLYNKIRTLLDSANISRIETLVSTLVTLNGLFDDRISRFNNKILFENGVVDLNAPTASVRKGRPSDFMKTSTNIPFQKPNPQGLDELRNFLKSLFPDNDTYMYMMNTCSQFLRGYNREKKLFFWTGSGNNGKSVFIKLIEKSFGDYHTTVPTEMFTESQTSTSKCTHGLNHIQQALIATATEPNPDRPLHSGGIKSLTGNDTMPIRHLFKTMKNVPIYCQFVMASNSVPPATQIDQAFTNRIEAVEFTSFFCDELAHDMQKMHNEVIEQHSRLNVKRVVNTYPKKDFSDEDLLRMARVFMYMLVRQYIKYTRDLEKREIPQTVHSATHRVREGQNIVQKFIETTFKNPLETISEKIEPILMESVYSQYRNYMTVKHCTETPLNLTDLKFAIINLYGNKGYIESPPGSKEDFLIGHIPI
jgi:P4 family phage/plasmid primase-like protien